MPGLYDPATGTTRFLVNVPGDWAGRPVAGPVGAALGLPAVLINDARAFGLAELRLGAGRGASSMVGLTLGTGVGGVIAVDGRVHQGHDGTAGELGHQTIEPGRTAGAAAATTAASRRSRGPTGSPRRAGQRRSRRRSRERGRATRGRAGAGPDRPLPRASGSPT